MHGNCDVMECLPSSRVLSIVLGAIHVLWHKFVFLPYVFHACVVSRVCLLDGTCGCFCSGCVLVCMCHERYFRSRMMLIWGVRKPVTAYSLVHYPLLFSMFTCVHCCFCHNPFLSFWMFAVRPCDILCVCPVVSTFFGVYWFGMLLCLSCWYSNIMVLYGRSRDRCSTQHKAYITKFMTGVAYGEAGVCPTNEIITA